MSSVNDTSTPQRGVNMNTPQGRAAQIFMEGKGLGSERPKQIERVEGEPCWYFIYELLDGDLELEVSWDAEGGWECTVTAFSLVD